MARARVDGEGKALVVSRNTCYGPTAFKTVERTMKRYGINSFSEAVRLLIEAGGKKLLRPGARKP